MKKVKKNPTPPNRIEIIAALMNETISFDLFALGFNKEMAAITRVATKRNITKYDILSHLLSFFFHNLKYSLMIKIFNKSN
jgi:hypothetical protein